MTTFGNTKQKKQIRNTINCYFDLTVTISEINNSYKFVYNNNYFMIKYDKKNFNSNTRMANR